MWEPGEPFYEAHLELDRAKKHIEKIHHNAIALVHEHSCATLAEDDPDSPGNLIWRLHVYKTIPDVFPLLVGRTILAIRSSINMISAIVTKSYGRFPSAPDFEGLVISIHGLEAKLGARIGSLETLDANDGGNFRNLKSLFKVNVGQDERVEVVYRVRAYRMHCDGEWVFPDAIVKPLKDREIMLCTPTSFRGLHCKAMHNIDTSIEVAFDDGGPFQGKVVRSKLETLAKDAFGVIYALLPLVK